MGQTLAHHRITAAHGAEGVLRLPADPPRQP
jgi:hypothetical protein